MSSKAASVRVEKLSKSFGNGRYPVLKNVSIDFPAGELTYILGPSGTGKSVLLKHILGLMKPDAGLIWINNQEITRLPTSKLAEMRHVFGVLFQNSALFDDMTVYENVAFPLREHTADSETVIRRKVSETLSHLGMPSGYDKYPDELSGGMRKRVGLARAIIREPSILLYDEPTTGLDPVTRSTVDELIATLKEELKLTSIVISHDISAAIALADKIVFLFEGEVVFSGSAKDFVRCKHDKIQEFLNSEKQSAQTIARVI